MAGTCNRSQHDHKCRGGNEEAFRADDAIEARDHLPSLAGGGISPVIMKECNFLAECRLGTLGRLIELQPLWSCFST